MGDTATERTALADRVMCDITHDVSQQASQHAITGRRVELGMPYRRANTQGATFYGELVEVRDIINVYEVRWPSQPESHGWHQALATGKNATIIRCMFRQKGDGFIDCGRCVIFKSSRFHRSIFMCLSTGNELTGGTFIQEETGR